MAPEVIESNIYNRKIDVYSFGIMMYEIITNSIPYPELEKDEKFTIFKFQSKVVNENYRPKFVVPVKESLKNLIEKCWSKDPQNRPSFEEIFNKLAYNFSESIFEREDDEYYLDDVDVEEVISYADSIQFSDNSNQLDQVLKKFQALEKSITPLMKENDTIKKENLKMKNDFDALKLSNNKLIKENNNIKTLLKKIVDDEIKPLKEENENLKRKLTKISKKRDERSEIKEEIKSESFFDIDINKITIKEFNSLSLQVQQNCISKILSTKMIEFFVAINDLLRYLLKLSPTDKSLYFRISANDDDLLYNMNENHIICLLSEALVLLFNNRQLSTSSAFFNILQQFKIVSVEINYPMNYFESLYTIISTFKMTQKIEINVFITNTDKVDSFFKNRKNIKSFILDYTVTQIEEGAFSGSSLEEIIIPESVSSIGSKAFLQCTSLKKVKIPCSVDKINNETFAECSSLINITIPSSVKTIGHDCFRGIISLEIFQNIPDSAFIGCSSLTNITISSSVQTIGNSAFSRCSSLTNITIPSSVQTIGSSVFSGCSSLTNITIPSSVQTIGNSVFSGCSSLTNITIQSAVKTIGHGCFEMSRNIQNIPDIAFNRCSSLNFNNPSSEKLIGGTLQILGNLQRIPKCLFSLSPHTRIIIPSTVKTIDDDAFNSCTNLSEMIIPASVIHIGRRCFSNCAKLRIIKLTVCEY